MASPHAVVATVDLEIASRLLYAESKACADGPKCNHVECRERLRIADALGRAIMRARRPRQQDDPAPLTDRELLDWILARCVSLPKARAEVRRNGVTIIAALKDGSIVGGRLGKMWIVSHESLQTWAVATGRGAKSKYVAKLPRSEGEALTLAELAPDNGSQLYKGMQLFLTRSFGKLPQLKRRPVDRLGRATFAYWWEVPR